MDFLELARQRRSVRGYRPDPVPPTVLEPVLEAARLAPTACNRQPFRLFVLETAGHEAELARIYHRPWFVQAPLVIGIVAVVAEAWVRRDGASYHLVDAAIAMDHLILAAASVGLGTCWVAAFDRAAAVAVLADMARRDWPREVPLDGQSYLVPSYDVEAQLIEVDLLPSWFWPHL
ncbi:MAG TPA: nitroreductase family protein, partial [Polyangiaceae bacterium]|nr:nitroreductase family protein [Polyangiaceae bacterium]